MNPTNKKMEAGTSDSGRHSRSFLDLPYVILNEVLGWLDSDVLKNLRIVCKMTKSLVEKPSHLNRFPILIMDDRRLEKVKNSSVEWINLTIGYECWQQDKDKSLLSYLQQVRSRLHIIKIKRDFISKKDVIDILASVGPQLRIFTCEGSLKLHRDAVDSVEEIQRTIDYMEERDDILKQNLIGLRHIQFLDMKFGGLHTAFLLLGKLLQCCPDLITLKIPLVYLDNPPNIGFGNPNKLTCLPLVSYLKTIASYKYRCLSKVDFGLNNYYHRFSNLLSLSESTLIKLAESSEPIGVKLYNVPASALPRHEYLTDNQKYCLNKSVASIECAEVASGIPDTVHVPPGCPIKIIVGHDDFSLFQLAESLNVVSIISTLSTSDSTSNIFRILFQVYRPCVTELELHGPDIVAAVGKDLASFFPNLKRLGIFRCRHCEPVKIWDLLDNLHHLEELRMNDVNISEYHTSGHSFAHRLGQMKNLKRVKIVSSTVDISVDFCTLATSSTLAQFLADNKTPSKHQMIVNLW